MPSPPPAANHDKSPRPSHRERVAQMGLFGRLVKNRVLEEGLFAQAAALAYNTLFSLLPMFVLALLVISIVSAGGSNDLGEQVQNWLLKQTGLDQIQVQTGGSESRAAGIDTQPVTPASPETRPTHVRTMSSYLSRWIGNVRQGLQSPTTGLLAFATLVYGALSLMLVIERTFNQVYGALKGRSWAKRITLYWCVLTLGPLCVAASIWLGRTFHDAAASVNPVRWTLAPLSLIGGFAASWILVTLLYKLVPETHVAWKSAAIGGFVGAVLWELGKYGFGIYVRTTVGYGKWYGTFGVLPLFMFWIYCTWIFMLAGLHIAYVHQHFATLARRAKLRDAHAVPIADVRWVLALGVLLYRAFRNGQAVKPEDAAEALGFPPEVVEHLFKALETARLVHRLDQKMGYALARPPEAVTADDLMVAGRALFPIGGELANPAGGLHDAPGIAELRDLETQWMRARTLVQLAEGQTK